MALEKPEDHDGATDDAEDVRIVQCWHMSCAGMGWSPHAEDPRAISTVLSKPASGGNGHSRREAIVFGLADLFFDYGQEHSAAELYQFYKMLRVFAYTRQNSRSKNRMAQAQHWKR